VRRPPRSLGRGGCPVPGLQLAFFFLALLRRFDCPDSDIAMATACLRLRTFLPLPLFKQPCLYWDMTLCTFRRFPDFVCGLRAAKLVTSFPSIH